MKVDMSKFGFNYDMEAEITDLKGTLLKKCNVREFDFFQLNGSFVQGIASLGVTYSVETDEDIDLNIIKPYNCQMIIDGTEYKIVFIKKQKSMIGGGFLNEKKYDTIFFLS